MRRSNWSALIIGLVAGAVICGTDAGRAQPSRGAIEHIVPLTTEERAAVERATLADPRVRRTVGPGPTRVVTGHVELDKAEAEAFLAGTSATPPTRRVDVFVLNAETNKAAQVLVAPAQNQVLTVKSVRPADVPFVRDDADQALTLVKASAEMRRVLGGDLDKFVIVDSGATAGAPFAAQILPLRSTAPSDPCTNDRCVDVIFRTQNGYLGVRAHVDLTRRTVSAVQAGGPHR